MKIRAIKSADVPELAAGYLEAFALVDPSEKWSRAAVERMIEFFLRTQPDLAFLGEAEEELMGGIFGLAKPWWDGVHLVQTELFIAPEFQKRGFGAALFQHFLKAAKSKYKAAKMESITFNDLEFPAAWYKKLGFADKNDWKVIVADIDELLAHFAV